MTSEELERLFNDTFRHSNLAVTFSRRLLQYLVVYSRQLYTVTEMILRLTRRLVPTRELKLRSIQNVLLKEFYAL